MSKPSAGERVDNAREKVASASWNVDDGEIKRLITAEEVKSSENITPLRNAPLGMTYFKWRDLLESDTAAAEAFGNGGCAWALMRGDGGSGGARDDYQLLLHSIISSML